MTKTQEVYVAEYSQLEAKETELENRNQALYDERVSLMFDKVDVSPINRQMEAVDKELAVVRRHMEDLEEEAGWNIQEDNDELFYAEQNK